MPSLKSVPFLFSPSLFEKERTILRGGTLYLIDPLYITNADSAGETPGGQRTVNPAGARTTSGPGGLDRHGRP